MRRFFSPTVACVYQRYSLREIKNRKKRKQCGHVFFLFSLAAHVKIPTDYMATTVEKHEESSPLDEPLKTEIILAWLDDAADEDPTIRNILGSLYDDVLIFTDPEECLNFIETMDNKDVWISVLISGKYGQMLVRERLQPLPQVRDIYVFCFDIVKHNQWGQTCDKVRCVFSDLNKILQCMQYDIQHMIEQHGTVVDEQQAQPLNQEQIQIQVQAKQQRRERFTDDNNLFDRLAMDLLMQRSDDGVEDFTNYCRTYHEDHPPATDDAAEEGEPVADIEEFFKPDQPIQEWYQPDLFFAQINSNDLIQLWTLRWFIRTFYRQLASEYEKFIQNKPKFTVYYGTWLSADELDGMKHRIGQMIIITELLMTCTNRQRVLDSLEEKKKNKNKIIFEIQIDPAIDGTIPYAEIKPEEILLWFGSRYRVSKVEYIEEEATATENPENIYWIIGLNLRPTGDSKSSRQTLYEYYRKEFLDLNNLRHAFGRILMHKGCYSQAEQWFQTDPQYLELAEIAIRRNNTEQAKAYLEHLAEDSDEANLLRAYWNILTADKNIPTARIVLMRIVSESTDRIIRARANIALGFLNIIMIQQIDHALDYFILANEVFRKFLPDIHPLIAKSHLGLGYAYYAQQKIAEAKESFETAFRIQRQALVYNHPDFAKTRNARAHCLSMDKRTTRQALKESEYALNILLETFPNEHQHHPEIVATINDMEKLRKGKELRPRHTLLDYI